MHRTIAMIFALRALLAPGAPAVIWPDQAPPAPNPAIVRVADAYVRAMLASDAAAVAAFYRDDAIEMPAGRPRVQGRAAIERYFRDLLKDAKVSTFTLTHTESRIVGDTAYDVGTYAQRLATPHGPFEDTGKYIVMLKLTGDAWRIAYAIHDSDRVTMGPPEPATGR